MRQLTSAYDRAHKMIMQRSGPPGELRHHCAVGEDGLYLIGVWQSEELLRSRFASAQFRAALAAAGFPPVEAPTSRCCACTQSSHRSRQAAAAPPLANG